MTDDNTSLLSFNSVVINNNGYFYLNLIAPKDDPGCLSDVECPNTESCRNRVCINPCIDGNPCSRTAQCLAQNHKAICTCPDGLIGDPFTNCYKEPVSTAECTHDSECSIDLACINKKCQNPCAEANPCARNAECRISYHRPLCYCPPGWGGDPQTMCYKRKFILYFSYHFKY